jgi:hypothetical protein
MDLPSVAVSRLQNVIWPRVKKKVLELFDEVKKAEIFSRDRVFCSQSQAQVGQAVRMNRVRFKELTDRLKHPMDESC